MIPILFNKDEKTFTSLGLGQMDATLVEVERERNGNYTLYAEVPFNSPQAKHLTKEMLIKADAGSRTKWQTFKINRTIKDTNADLIKVYADHISMDTINDAMKPKVVITQQTAEGALRQWANSLVSGKAYDVQSDITHVGSTEWTIDEVENARQALGGVSGSILDVWGGEYEFDNNTIILHKEMGRTAPTVLEYGRNIVSLEYEELIDGVYTSIYPYATYTPKSEDNKQLPDVMVTLDELIVDSEYAGNYETRRIQIVDFSNEFDSNAENPEIPTQDKLRTLAKAYVKNNGYGIPKISQEIDFVDLSKTLDYQDIQVMEEIELNDRVPVYYPNIDAETNDVKVTTTNWDVLNNRYSKITLSTIGAMNTNSITSKLNTAIKDLKAEQKKINNTVPYLINGQGNRVWWTTPDDNMEHKIDDTWFKKNGKYTIIYKWNGSMWEEVLNDETFITEIESEVAKAQEEAEKASQSAKDADTRAGTAIEKAGANANLLQTHQNTLNTINNTTLPNISSSISSAVSDAKSALSSASSAMDEARKADGKIADYVTKNGLVSGTTVDSKINTATGEISKKITTVEGKIPTTLGGRNYLLNSSYIPYVQGTEVEYKGNLATKLKSPSSTNYAQYTPEVSEDLIQGETYTYSALVAFEGVKPDGIELYLTPLSSYTRVDGFEDLEEGKYGRVYFTRKASTDGSISRPHLHIRGGDGYVYLTKWKLEKGSVVTDWSPAPEDNLSQSEFQIFESTYDEDVKGIHSTLTDLSNKKLDGTTYTNFYNNEYKKTAKGVTDTWTAVNKIVDENGNTTDTFAKAVYDRNAQRQTADFQNVTNDLVTTATYSEGVKGINSSITTIQGKLDNLGSPNLVLDSNKIVENSSYFITSYDMTENLIGGETYTVTVWGDFPSGVKVYHNGSGGANHIASTSMGNNSLVFVGDNKYELTVKVYQGIPQSTQPRFLIYQNGNNTDNRAVRIDRVMITKGEHSLSYQPAPSDMMGKVEFTTFKGEYERNDQTIKNRLTSIDSGADGSILYNTNLSLSTAQGNTKEITSVKGKLDNLGSPNLLKNSWHNDIDNPAIINTNYNIKSWNLDKPLVVGKTYTFRLFGFSNRSFFLLTTSDGNATLLDRMSNGADIVIRRERAYNGLSNRNVWEKTFTLTQAQSDHMTSNIVRLYNYSQSETGNGEVYWATLVEGKAGIDWSPAVSDNLGKSEFTVFKNEYEDTAEGIINRLTAIDSSEEGSVVTRLNATKKTADENSNTLTKVNNIITIQDTRRDNQIPRWYRQNYPKTTVQEFKDVTAIRDSNIPYTAGFGILTTTIVWNDTSGGTVQQVFSKDNLQYVRRGWTDDSGWSPWVKMTNQEDIKNFVSSTSTEYQTIKERSDLYERVIGSSTEAGMKQKISRVVMTDSVFKTEVVEKMDINARIANGKPLAEDPNFEKGLEGLIIYNNSNNGNVIFQRMPTTSTHANAPAKDYIFEIKSLGQASPGRGGFRIVPKGGSSNWYEGGEYVLDMVAKLPAGARLDLNNNSLGTGGELKWITDNKGTGQYERYQAYAKLGAGHHSIPIFYVSIIQEGDTTRWYQFAKIEVLDINYSLGSSITQLADNINLKVSKGDLISQINVQAGGVLIQSGTNKLNITPTTTYIQNGTIESAMIKSLDAGKIKTGTLDASKATITNIDANNITANKTSFVQSVWNSLESSIRIDGGGLLSTASDKSQVYLQNGVVGARNPSGATIGQIGYAYESSSPWYSMQISHGSHFQIRMSRGAGELNKQAFYIISGGTESYLNTDNIYLNPSSAGRVRVQGAMTVDKDIRAEGTVLVRQKLEYLNGGFIESQSANSNMLIASSNKLIIYTNGSNALEFDANNAVFRRKVSENSDIRLKTNIVDMPIDSLDAIRNMEIKKFDYLDGRTNYYGIIAQQAQQYLPELINTDSEGYLMVDKSAMTYVNMHAIQQLDSKVDDEVAKLKAQVASLQEELALLKGE